MRKNCFVVACLLALAVVLLAWTDPDRGEIRATSMIIVDQYQRPRIRLSCNETGPSLVLQDERGQVRATLIVAEGISSLTLADGNGTRRAEIMVSEGRAVRLSNGGGGDVRAGVFLEETGARIRFFDQAGELVRNFP